MFSQCVKTSFFFKQEVFPQPKGRKQISPGSDALYLERVNYPSNCFTLNIKKDTEEEANGIIRITFFLKRPESADSKETKKLQNLFWLPLIQIHTGTDTTDGYIISIQIQRPSGEMEKMIHLL